MWPFYHNMKLLSNCPYFKKPEKIPGCMPAYTRTLVTFASFGALITFAAFVKFIRTSIGIFQLGKVFFTKVSPSMHLSVFFYLHIYLKLGKS